MQNVYLFLSLYGKVFILLKSSLKIGVKRLQQGFIKDSGFCLFVADQFRAWTFNLNTVNSIVSLW